MYIKNLNTFINNINNKCRFILFILFIVQHIYN